MIHDATHCIDYNPDTCPENCYRAQLSEDVKNFKYFWPVTLSYARFENTRECPKSKEKRDD